MGSIKAIQWASNYLAYFDIVVHMTAKKLFDSEKLVIKICEAWVKYREFFGDTPHGTEKQTAALIELGVNAFIQSECRENRIEAVKEFAKKIKNECSHCLTNQKITQALSDLEEDKKP